MQMLYRISGERESRVHKITLGKKATPVECKAFNESELDAAKDRGWQEHAAVLAFVETGSVAGKESGPKKAEKQAEQKPETAEAPAYPTEDRDALVQWIRDNGYADKIDLRKSLPVLIEQLEKVLNG